MNILYIAHRIPYPPNKGEKIRAFHQISHLSRNHSVHLVCFVDDPADIRHIDSLRECCASVDYVYRHRIVAKMLAAAAILGRRPLSVAGFHSRELAGKIHERLRSSSIDRILVFCSPMAEYVWDVADIPKVIDIVDVDSDKWRLYQNHHRAPLSWLFGLECERLGRYEERVVNEFDASILVTEREAQLLRGRCDDGRIEIISNGVDLESFKPVSDGRPDGANLVFTGVMDYYPNIDAVQYFCSEVFPLVLRDRPDAKFLIVGRNPTRAVTNLGRHRNVVVTGEVAEVSPFLAQASMAVVPLRLSRGVQNKILEAMAMGLPVVTTPEAIGGTEATTEDGIRVAGDPQSFATEVVDLLGDDAARRDCSWKARRYVERCHRWENQGARLEDLLVSVGESSCGNRSKDGIE